MGWEEPLSRHYEPHYLAIHLLTGCRIVVEHVRRLTEAHPKAQLGAEGMSVLNVGFGLGIVRSHLEQHCVNLTQSKGRSVIPRV